jgi:hypothetical protein
MLATEKGIGGRAREQTLDYESARAAANGEGAEKERKVRSSVFPLNVIGFG